MKHSIPLLIALFCGQIPCPSVDHGFQKTFSWPDYPEYPRCPAPGTVDFNEIRYLRRYRAYNIAQETLKSKYLLEYLRKENPNIKFPTDVEIEYMVSKEIGHFVGITDFDPENPKNDPDDE